jgi:hypothetical protein
LGKKVSNAGALGSDFFRPVLLTVPERGPQRGAWILSTTQG